MTESAAPQEEYFYTTIQPSRPHGWQSSLFLSTLNPDNGFEKIASLEEAKQLAEKFAVGGYEEDRCETTYGVQYRVDADKQT